jgi:hypothetical protein
MANKTKLQACKAPRPAAKAATDGQPAVCDKRPGHKDAHGRRGMRAKW